MKLRRPKDGVHYSWYDRGYGTENPFLEAGMLVGMGTFFLALAGFSHLVGLYEKLRYRRAK
jgi:hypothetical protein